MGLDILITHFEMTEKLKFRNKAFKKKKKTMVIVIMVDVVSNE